jgi:hypothetical protein
MAMKSETARFVTGETSAYRPRVSRETRRLLMTALLAVLTLWVLARIRFPDRPVNPNPVTPLLSQLAGFSKFSDLAATVEDLRARVAPTLVTVGPDITDATEGLDKTDERMAALRLRDDLAIAILEPGAGHGERNSLGVIAEDRASGLAVLRVGNGTNTVLPVLWSPQRLDKPQYVAVSSPSPDSMSLRPAFIGSLTPVETPAWIGPVWRLPRDVDVTPGAFLFTDDAEFVGAVVRYENGLAVVPGKMLWDAAEDLLRQPHKEHVDLGIDVEALTPRLSLASGADTGVVITWIDPNSVVAGQLKAGDVIQAVDDVSTPTPEHWRVRTARLGAGDTIAIRVWRGGTQRELLVVAATPAAVTPTPTLGLTMRTLARVGVEVVRVERGSAADAAGIEAGDVITAVGASMAPSAAQVESAFTSARRGDFTIVTLMRGPAHRVVALQR